MNYMMLVYLNEQEIAHMGDEAPKGCESLAAQLRESGHYQAGAILQPTSMATSLRLRQGQRMVTDGPFAETREQLAGYLIVEAADLDEALEVAAMHPIAQVGTIEIRPILEVP